MKTTPKEKLQGRTGVNRQIKQILLRDSLIFGVGTVLVVGALYLGRLVHYWAHGLCNCTPGLLVEYGPSATMILGASMSTLLTLRSRTRERLVAKNNLELANQQLIDNLDAAASIQESFLPQSSPDVQGLHFAWHFEPCEELAGDIFNLLRLDEKTLAMYSLDVSGHGVASALLSVTLNRILLPLAGESSTIRQYTDASTYRPVSPVRVAELLNQQFIMNPEEPQYFTLLYGLLNLETFEFSFVCAGHPGPIYHPHGKSPRVLEIAGYPVGLLEQASWENHSLQLDPGDRLYLYSDGITEAMNQDEEHFGQQRLLDVLSESRSHSLEESVARVISEVHKFASPAIQDDLSILATEVSSNN